MISAFRPGLAASAVALALAGCASVSGIADKRTGVQNVGDWTVEGFESGLTSSHYCLATRPQDDGATIGMVKTGDGAGPLFGWPVAASQQGNPTITYRLNTRRNYAPSATSSVFGRYYAIVYPAGSGGSALNDLTDAAQITYWADDPALGEMGPYSLSGVSRAERLLQECYSGTW